MNMLIKTPDKGYIHLVDFIKGYELPCGHKGNINLRYCMSNNSIQIRCADCKRPSMFGCVKYDDNYGGVINVPSGLSD